MAESLSEEQQRLLMQGLPINNPVSVPEISPEIRQMAAPQQQPQMTTAQQLLQQYAAPREFQAPGSFKEGVTNAFQNVLVRPLQESLGIRESAADTLRRLQSNVARLDYVNTLEQRQRDSLARGVAGMTDLQKYPPQIQRAFIVAEQVEPGSGFQVLRDYDQRFDTTATQEYSFRAALPEDERPNFDQYQQSTRARTNISTVGNQADKLSLEGVRDNFSTLRDAYTTGQSTLVNTEVMRDLISSGLRTGFGAEFFAYGRRALDAVGFDVAGTSGEELFAGASNQLVLPLVKQLGVNPTDKDLDFVVTASPTLAKSAEGNLLMLDVLDFKRDRDTALYEAAQSFRELDARGSNNYRNNPTLFEIEFNRHMMQAANSDDFRQRRRMLRAKVNRAVKGADYAEAGSGAAAANEILDGAEAN